MKTRPRDRSSMGIDGFFGGRVLPIGSDHLRELFQTLLQLSVGALMFGRADAGNTLHKVAGEGELGG